MPHCLEVPRYRGIAKGTDDYLAPCAYYYFRYRLVFSALRPIADSATSGALGPSWVV